MRPGETAALLAALHGSAVTGDTKAAQTLLAVRHGLPEKMPAASSAEVDRTLAIGRIMESLTNWRHSDDGKQIGTSTRHAHPAWRRHARGTSGDVSTGRAVMTTA